MNRFMKWHHYDVLRTERPDLLEGVLPIDLMAELYNAKAKDEMLVFSLTAKAFFATCSIDKTNVTFFKTIPFMLQNVAIRWEEIEEGWLELQTWDKCESFFLQTANTKNFVYALPKKGAKVIHYVIG